MTLVCAFAAPMTLKRRLFWPVFLISDSRARSFTPSPPRATRHPPRSNPRRSRRSSRATISAALPRPGTGKTAAFALPILQRFFHPRRTTPPRGCRTLVLCPTRELANQIVESFRIYGRGTPISVMAAFGGVAIGTQQRRLASGVDILVATPGRLLDLIERKSLALSSVEVLVLDEADRMLDLGFIHALKRIVKLVPRQRQTLLFSATMPRPIAELAQGIPQRSDHSRRDTGRDDGRSCRSGRCLCRERRQARAAGAIAARPVARAGARLHPDQARCGPGRAPS